MKAKCKIVIAGGSGFLGRNLATELLTRNYQVVILTRGSSENKEGLRFVHWDGETIGPWVIELERADALVNLAGRSVDCRYNDKNKKEIIESRVNSVNVLSHALRSTTTPPKVWIQAGTLAIFADAKDKICNEDSEIAQGFSPDVGKAWEKAFFENDLPGIRKVFLRISFVLSKNGGALPAFANLVKYFIGGASGNGQQYMSWLHEDDFNEMVIWAIEKEQTKGLYHATSLQPVTNEKFMRTLRQLLGRPWSPRIPAWAVKLGTFFMGTEAELVLRGRWCQPKRFIEEKFPFKFPQFDEALRDVLGVQR